MFTRPFWQIAGMVGDGGVAVGQRGGKGDAAERFLDHPKPWVRKEAERALKKIEKAS